MQQNKDESIHSTIFRPLALRLVYAGFKVLERPPFDLPPAFHTHLSYWSQVLSRNCHLLAAPNLALGSLARMSVFAPGGLGKQKTAPALQYEQLLVEQEGGGGGGGVAGAARHRCTC